MKQRSAMTFFDRVSDTCRFAVRFFRHPRRVSSLVPSSRAFGEKMFEGIDVDNATCIVELWPGIGNFCDQMLERFSQDGTWLMIELDPEYAKRLRSKYAHDPRVLVVEGSAWDLELILEQHGYAETPIDAIISGLPTPSIPPDEMRCIVSALRKYTNQATKFRMLTYMPNVVPKYYEGLPLRRLSKTWRNFPPAYVLGVH